MQDLVELFRLLAERYPEPPHGRHHATHGNLVRGVLIFHIWVSAGTCRGVYVSPDEMLLSPEELLDVLVGKMER